MQNIVLSSQERQSLLSLKKTAELQKQTENRLATGLKVDSVTDNPASFYRSKSLSDRAQMLLEKIDGIEQATSLVTATFSALDGVTNILQQMKGLVSASAVPSSIDPAQFDDTLAQLNNITDDASYLGTNLLANFASPGEPVRTSSHSVDFSEEDGSELVVNGAFAGSSYYLSTGGETKLIPEADGTTLTLSGSNASQVAVDEDQVQVNTTTSGTQRNNSIAPLEDGGYVVVWQDNSSLDGGGFGIVGQRFDEDGAKVGSEFVINSTTAGDQLLPSITGLSDGGFAVTWQDANAADGDGTGIYAQRFDANMAKVGGEFLVNTTNTTGDQYYPQLTGLDDGGMVVTWVNRNADDGSGYGVYAHRFDANMNSVGGEVQINTTTSGDQSNPRVAVRTDGSYVIAWTDENSADGSGSGVFAQIFNPDGSTLGSEFQVNTTTANNQKDAGVTGLAGGGFVVTWHEENTQDIYAQVYGSDGTKVGSEYQVNTSGGTQAGPEVRELSDGGFLVMWVDYSIDGSSGGVVGRRFDALGTALGSEFLVNTVTAGNQDKAELATLKNGDFVVTWTDYGGEDGDSEGVFSRRFSLGLTGGTVSGSSVVATDYDNNQVVVDVGGVRQKLTLTPQGLGVANAWYYQDFDTVEGREQALKDIDEGLSIVRSLSARFGSDLSLLQTRAQFTENYTNTLNEGSDKLTLADLNEEGANLLALQTRKSLGVQALSFLGQASQNILNLFR